MYTRYAIIINEKPIGLFAGLPLAINKHLADDLMEPFNEKLNIPDFYYLKGKNGKKDIYAYFTDLGLKRFEKEIKEILFVLEKNNQKVLITTQSKVGTARLIYEDKYQVLIKKKK